jgi:hypothetical protein
VARNEAETRAELIDPVLVAAGWGQVDGSRVAREYVIAPGRILGAGRPQQRLILDYLMLYRNRKLAVVEAKAEDKPLTEGLGQAKQYAESWVCGLHMQQTVKAFMKSIWRLVLKGQFLRCRALRCCGNERLRAHRLWRQNSPIFRLSRMVVCLVVATTKTLLLKKCWLRLLMAKTVCC